MDIRIASATLLALFTSAAPAAQCTNMQAIKGDITNDCSLG